MFANHPTIVALHANSFCKYLKLLVQILLIRLCLQCITGAVRLAPVRSKSRGLCWFPVYQHVITFEKSLPRQIFCEKSASTNVLRKINQAFQRTDHMVWGSHVIQTLPWCASILNCHTILSHHLEISPCCAVFSLRCFDFANGSKHVARVCSTSGRDGRFYQKHKLSCQINC